MQHFHLKKHRECVDPPILLLMFFVKTLHQL